MTNHQPSQKQSKKEAFASTSADQKQPQNETVFTLQDIEAALRRKYYPEIVDDIDAFDLGKPRTIIRIQDGRIKYIIVGDVPIPRFKKRHAVGGTLISLFGVAAHFAYTHMDLIANVVGVLFGHKTG